MTRSTGVTAGARRRRCRCPTLPRAGRGARALAKAGCVVAVDDRHDTARRHVRTAQREREALLRLDVHAERRVRVGDRVQRARGTPHARDEAREVPHVPVRRRSVELAVEQVGEHLRGAGARAPEVARRDVHGERHGALERERRVEQARERRLAPRAVERDRREAPVGELVDRAHEPRGGRPRLLVRADERRHDAVVAPPALARWQEAHVRDARDRRARRARDCVLVERAAAGRAHPRGLERESAAKRAAEVIALRQLARLRAQELDRSGEQRQAERR
jgi:hypothetical protein